MFRGSMALVSGDIRAVSNRVRNVVAPNQVLLACICRDDVGVGSDFVRRVGDRHPTGRDGREPGSKRKRKGGGTKPLIRSLSEPAPSACPCRLCPSWKACRGFPGCGFRLCTRFRNSGPGVATARSGGADQQERTRRGSHAHNLEPGFFQRAAASERSSRRT